MVEKLQTETDVKARSVPSCLAQHVDSLTHDCASASHSANTVPWHGMFHRHAALPSVRVLSCKRQAAMHLLRLHPQADVFGVEVDEFDTDEEDGGKLGLVRDDDVRSSVSSKRSARSRKCVSTLFTPFELCPHHVCMFLAGSGPCPMGPACGPMCGSFHSFPGHPKPTSPTCCHEHPSVPLDHFITMPPTLAHVGPACYERYGLMIHSPPPPGPPRAASRPGATARGSRTCASGRGCCPSTGTTTRTWPCGRRRAHGAWWVPAAVWFNPEIRGVQCKDGSGLGSHSASLAMGAVRGLSVLLCRKGTSA